MIPQLLPSGLLVRRAGPADAAALQALVSRSDVLSRYSRFHGAVKRLPASYLHQLVDRPASEHDALVVEVDGRLVAFGDLGPVAIGGHARASERVHAVREKLTNTGR